MPQRIVAEHPSPKELRQFAEGSLCREEARRVVEHILQGCRACGDEAARCNLLRLKLFQPERFQAEEVGRARGRNTDEHGLTWTAGKQEPSSGGP